MKKCINYLVTVFILFFLFNINCYASTETYTRTSDNLRIPSDVVADSSNYNDIMSTPSVNADEKVYDFANILEPEQERSIYEQILEYNKVSNYDAVVVTVDDLVGKDISKYAYDFYDYNDFKLEGVIFVVHTRESNPEIFMGNCAPKGSFLFNIYDDSAVNSTLGYIYNNSIINGNYYEACFNFVKIVNGLYIQKQNNTPRIGGGGGSVSSIPLFELLVISLALSFIIVIILVKLTSNNNNYKYSLNDNIKESSLNIVCDYDKLIQ